MDSLYDKNVQLIRKLNPLFIDQLPGEENKWIPVYDESSHKIVNLRNKESDAYLYPSGVQSGIDQELAAVESWKLSPQRMVINNYVGLKDYCENGSPLTDIVGAPSLQNLTLEDIHDLNTDLEPLWTTYKISEYLKENDIRHYPAALTSNDCALVVFGMGLCQQFKPVIEFLSPSALFIVEPDLSLLEHSLRLLDYEWLINTFSGPNKAFDFITSSSPESAVENIRSLITNRNLFLLDGLFSYATRPNAYSNLAQSLLHTPATLNTVNYLGYFVDEIHMTMNAVLNYFFLRPRVFSTDRIPENNRHALVLASGPSLSENIELIKRHRDKYTIFSCYSTIGKLLAEDILPDYHCDLERHNDHIPLIEQGFQEHLKSIVLCASSTCDPRLLQLYKDVICVNRGALTPSVIFSDRNDIIPNEGPDVATFAILSAIFLGFRSIHLFGVDLGTADRSRCRLEGALDIDRRTYDVPYRGNLGKTVFTSQPLLDNKNAIEANIQFYTQIFPALKIYNYSNGVLIQNAISSEPNEFLSRIEDSVRGDGAEYTSFVPYSDEHVRQVWAVADMRGRCFKYLNQVRTLAENPFDIATLYSISDMCNAVGKSNQDQIPIRFYRGSLFRSWIILWGVYLRCTLPHEDDQVNMKLFATKVIGELVDSLESLTFQMIDFVESVNSVDEFTFQSKMKRDDPDSKPLSL